MIAFIWRFRIASEVNSVVLTLVMRYMVDRTQLVVATRYLYSLPQRNRCEIKELVENYKKRKKITAVRTNLHSTVYEHKTLSIFIRIY